MATKSREIKKALTTEFPGIKFSVTCRQGSRYTVKWADGVLQGVTDRAVQEIAQRWHTQRNIADDYDPVYLGDCLFYEHDITDEAWRSHVIGCIESVACEGAYYSEEGKGFRDRNDGDLPAIWENRLLNDYLYNGVKCDLDDPESDSKRQSYYRMLESSQSLRSEEPKQVEQADEKEEHVNHGLHQEITPISIEPCNKEMQGRFPCLNKLNTVSEYQDYLDGKEDGLATINCHVGEVINLTTEDYDRFCKSFLTDYAFLAKKGGYVTLADSKESLKACVLVVAEQRQLLLVDPQGHSYARYVGLVHGDRFVCEPEEVEQSQDIVPLRTEPCNKEIRGKFPNINQLDTIAEYREYLDGKADGLVVVNCFAEEMITLAPEDYDRFTSSLLVDRSFLAGKGGRTTFGGNREYLSACVLVLAEEREPLLIDPDGNSDARYVGLVYGDSFLYETEEILVTEIDSEETPKEDIQIVEVNADEIEKEPNKNFAQEVYKMWVQGMIDRDRIFEIVDYETWRNWLG